MPTIAKKSVKSKASKQSATPKLAEKDVLAWLQQHPNFFEKHKDSLSTLSIPKKGGNILSLHAAKAEKLAADHKRLATRQKQLIAMAQSNASVADSLMSAITGLMPLSTFADLRTYTQTKLRASLGLSATRLYQVGKADTATTLTVQTITTLAPKPVTLRQLEETASREMYGPKGKMLKSDCLLPLTSASGKLLGLLALASDDATRFHAGQATSMAEHFGTAMSGCLQRLAGKSTPQKKAA